MVEFNIEDFEVAHNKLKAVEQEQIDAQAAAQPQVDPNAPAEPQGFDMDRFFGVDQGEPAELLPPLEEPEQLNVGQAAPEPGGIEEPVDRSRELLSDEKATKLLSQLGGEIPSKRRGPKITPSGPSFSGVGVQQAVQTRKTTEQQIKELGYNNKDIAAALAFQQANTPPSKKFQQGLATAASIAIPAAINLIPGLAAAPEEIITVPLVTKALARLGLQAAGAGGAGAVGAVADIAADPDRDLTADNIKAGMIAGGVEEAIVEGAFGGIQMGGARAFGRSGRLAAENVDEINDILSRQAKRDGISQSIQLPPGATSKLPSAQVAQAVAESSFFGANPFKKTRELLKKTASTLVKDIPETFAEGASNFSDRQITELTQAALKGEYSFSKGAAQAVYDQSFDIIDEVGKELVDVTKKVATPAGKILSETGEAITKAGTKEVTEQVPKAGLLADLTSIREVGNRLDAEFVEAQNFGYKGKVKELVQLAQDVNDNTTARGVQRMRSIILGEQRDLAKTTNPNSLLEKVIGDLVPVLNETMDSAAEAASGTAKKLLTRANAMWKANEKNVNNATIEKILGKAADTNPKVVYDVLNSADELQVDQLISGLSRTAGGKKVVNKKALDKIKGGYLAGMIGDVQADAFKSSGKAEPLGDMLLERFNEIPQQVKDRLFSPAQQDDMLLKFRGLSLAQQKSKALIAVKGAEIGGLIALTASPFAGKRRGDAAKTGAALVIGPSVLASLILRRPAFSRALAEGFDVDPLTREGIKLAGRLGRMVISERKRITKGREDASKKATKSPTAPSLKQLRGFGGRGF